MKLLKARVMNYKSVEDSGWVTINNVTCLVGKNESGKTAFLQSLQKLSHVDGVNGDFDILDYPRKGFQDTNKFTMRILLRLLVLNLNFLRKREQKSSLHLVKK